MPENEPVSSVHADLEAKFLEILSQPDVVIPKDEIPGDGEFSKEQRATLRAVLEAEMPSPEEIERDIKIAQHNAEIQQKRDRRQAAKRARRDAQRRRRR